MQLRTLAGVLLLLVAATTPATAAAGATQETTCAFPVERTDATGTNVTVESEPSRIVTLNPSAAQTLWEMGAQDKVVGVTKHAMNLEGAQSKENVSGAGQTINNEEVVALQPDLVLAPNTVSNETVGALRDAGLTVYRFHEAKSIDAIYEKTRLTGELTGECAAAEETVGWMQDRLAVVDDATEGQERPDAIYTFFGHTAGNGTFIGNVIERAGADNVAAEAGIQSYQELNTEILVQRNPDWIVRNSDQPAVPKTVAYNGTAAVQRNQSVVIDTDLLNRPGPRVVYAVTKLTEAFHPEAYAAANASAANATASESTDATNTSGDASNATATTTDDSAQANGSAQANDSAGATATDGSGPGFGAVGAVVALGCVALLGRRRV